MILRPSSKKSLPLPEQIFLDFDGTLIDCTQRLYRLFCQLVPECQLSYADYWAEKRKAVTQSELLQRYWNYSPVQCEQVKSRWMAAVESEDALQTDLPIPGAAAWLAAQAACGSELILVTARQSTSHVKLQLKQLGWTEYFAHVLVTEQRHSKAELMQRVLRDSAARVMVGDTGEDIKAGQEIGAHTVAVTSGFLSADVLARYTPDMLISSLAALDLVALLQAPSQAVHKVAG